MAGSGEQLARAALGLVGVPFRLGGRDRRCGLDCVGVIALALEECGRTVGPIPRYGLRQHQLDGFIPALHQSGLVPATGAEAVGDVLLLSPGPGQLHLALRCCPHTIVHAHAGLGRVVREPAPVPAPALRRWHLI